VSTNATHVPTPAGAAIPTLALSKLDEGPRGEKLAASKCVKSILADFWCICKVIVRAMLCHIKEDTIVQLGLVTVTTYNEMVEEFARNAEVLAEQGPLLKKTREAYQQATDMSAELRSSLEAGDESLRLAMADLERAFDLRSVQPTSEDKGEKQGKIEVISPEGRTAVAMNQ
jgi:hypothetical protein